jgi:glucan 1,4-alpha-glucosidase
MEARGGPTGSDTRLVSGRARRLVAAGAAMSLPLALLTSMSGTAAAAPGSEAPGTPGASANWTTGNKQGLGTAVGRASKVWYTLADGAMSEVYYPTGNTANVRSLEFAVTDGASFADRESENTTHAVQLVDRRSLTYQQVNTAKSGRYRITKTYVTDPGRQAVLMSVTFQPLTPGAYRLFTLYDPAIGNSSLHDTATRAGTGSSASLLASDGDLASALVASSGFARTSNGFVGTSDGWTDLAADYRLDWDYDSATDGNVLQTGEVPLKAEPGDATKFTLALGFGDSTSSAASTARASLASTFPVLAAAYQNGWHDYLKSLLKTPRALTGRMATQYDVAVMTVRAHEDKTNPGAFIASLTLPWGFAANADEGGEGYHKVWARDEYQQVSSLLAAGDRAAADRAVSWLFTRQQLADGTFPQTSKVDGTAVDHAVQLDETAFPIILAWQAGRTDNQTWAGVRAAANALVARGPTTPQERWEETGGYSDTTIPDMIAGLVAASDIARQRGDTGHAALWLGVADEWQRSIERWLFTTTGPYGDHRYYIRIDDDGDPNDESARDFGNAAGVHLEKAVVDAGFLDLVRLGVKAPNDPYVAESLAETDASLATDTPSGRVWHRYTFDGYGEKADGSPWALNTPGTKGRAWPLLSGERGEYEVANGRSGLSHLQTMANTANDGFMIPEQVWDQPEPAPAPYGYQPGKATGSASPLAWAMAQYVRLARAIDAGRPVETPTVVAQRYASGAQRSVPALELTSPADRTVADRPQVTVSGTTDATQVYIGVGDDVQAVTPQAGAFEATVPLALGGNKITVVALADDGGTSMRQVTVVSFGTRLAGLTDPSGDDNGPGTYVYPTASVYRPGIFDLTGLDIYVHGDDTLFVATIRGEVTNDFGGQGISHQRFNVYVGSGTGDAVPALPGTNMNTASPWTQAIVGDGRFDTAGVYTPAGTRTAAGQILAVPETHQIAVVVPSSAVAGVDLASAHYGIAMFGNAEAGEGVGYVRPVYDLAYWQNPGPDFWWITQYRFGGGAGVWNDTPSHDSDTRDPNAIDVIVGPGQSQADVMNWQAASPVALPMVPLVP